MTIEERNKLVEQHFSYACKFSNKYRRSIPDKDYRLMIAWEALVRAVETYDPSKGAKITGHIARSIHWDMLKEWNSNHCLSRDARLLSLDARIPGDNHGSYSLHDVIASDAANPLDMVAANDARKEIQVAMKSLSATEQTVISEHYLSDKTPTFFEIGTAHSRSRQWAQQVEKRALRKMRSRINYLHRYNATFGR